MSEMSRGAADVDRDIEIMVSVLLKKDSPDLRYGVAQLRIIQAELTNLSKERSSNSAESVRRRFLRLLEDQPILNKAYLVACYADLVDIVSKRLQYFIDMANKRKLTNDEERMKRTLEAELANCKTLLEEALCEAEAQ